MLRTLLIGPDDQAGQELASTLALNASIIVQRRLNEYPRPVEMVRLLRCCAPECLFISSSNIEGLTEILQLVGQEMPNLAIVAFDRTSEVGVLQQLLQLGIREFLSSPIRETAVQGVVVRVEERLRKTPVQLTYTDHLYTFLPAKPGVGASTLALQTALYLTERRRTKTLIVDCDLSAGLLQWMLKLDNTFSIADAVERADELDDNFWPQLVASRGLLDLLSAGIVNPSLRLEPLHLRTVIGFARRRYEAVIVDLSGNLERYAFELMAESKRIFLVTTPELPALYLAGEKLRYLQQIDLGDRVQLLVNRSAGAHDAVPLAQIEQFIGLPVTMSFPNDYRGVNRAMSDGESVSATGALGRQLAELGELLVPSPLPDGMIEPIRRRWGQLFSQRARYSNG